MINVERTRAVLIAVAILIFVPSFAAFAEEVEFPGKQWATATPADVGLDEAKLKKAREYALTGGGSGYVTRRGKLVMSWGDPKRRYDLKSTTKSIGVTALGLAIKDGKIKLADKARQHHPTLGTPPAENEKSGWINQITIGHLATQTAGFEKPGGYTRIVSKPGTQWAYSDGGPNWLAECITLKYRRDLRDLMFERVFIPLGIGESDLSWRNNSYRPHKIDGVARREFGSGISANVDAMARIGYLYLREGRWGETQIIPRDFVAAACTTISSVVGLPDRDAKRFGNASDHYGLLWWNNADGTLKNVPRDAYWSWGLYDSLIVVMPSQEMVVVRAGKSWQRNWEGHYDVLRPFLQPIAAAVKQERNDGASPAECAEATFESGQITGIRWAPASTIVRRAKGSDNWPITWGDDDRLYTAYGDGWGFEPRTKKKLSLGISRIVGGPPDFVGANIRSETGEQLGDGAGGKKASGMLMVGGVLYMLVRNAGNAQLAWSDDHGQSWKWNDWKFTSSFGCPTFLNYGKNYAGARDEFAYIYSFDSDSAYKPADRFVLARVETARIKDRPTYEFFGGMSEAGKPKWTKDIKAREAVLSKPGKCYRSGVSYNAPLKTYLWAQIIPGGDTRFRGGLAVYAASEPWGSWREIFAAKNWDVGPGESASFPTKWISQDGRTVHLVFSGDDCFSARKAELVIEDDK